MFGAMRIEGGSGFQELDNRAGGNPDARAQGDDRDDGSRAIPEWKKWSSLREQPAQASRRQSDDDWRDFQFEK